MTKPINPREVSAAKKAQIPAEVFRVFNTLIVRNYTDGRAVVGQREAVNEIGAVLGVGADEVFRNGWLDIEEAYRNEGWRVVYDKPAYCETYEATFTFTAA